MARQLVTEEKLLELIRKRMEAARPDGRCKDALPRRISRRGDSSKDAPNWMVSGASYDSEECHAVLLGVLREMEAQYNVAFKGN